MNVNVLVTGTFPPTGTYKDLTDILYRIHTNLVDKSIHSVKIFYHSWKREDLGAAFVPENKYLRHARQNVFLDDMPVCEYNPYKKTKHTQTKQWLWQLEKHSKREWWRHQPQPGHITRNLQIISTSNLIKKIKKRYPADVYIRVRWDAILSHNVDYDRLINHVVRFNEPVGCMLETEMKGSDDQRKKDKYYVTRERFEKGDFHIEKRIPDNRNWHDRVSDALIIFKPEWFDTKLVEHWWNKKELIAAEWAWWQVLCVPNKLRHLNIDGVAVVLRQYNGVKWVP